MTLNIFTKWHIKFNGSHITLDGRICDSNYIQLYSSSRGNKENKISNIHRK